MRRRCYSRRKVYTMKQIAIKKLKQICGCKTNNDFANLLSIYLHDSSEIAKIYGLAEYGDLLQERGNKIYAKLQELRYYEEV